MAQQSNQAADEVRNAAKPGEPVSKGGEHGGPAQPSGPKGDNPATAGPGATGVVSRTPENALGHLNPSSPEDGNTTPGSTTVK